MTSVNNIALKEMTSVSNKESPTTVDDIVKVGKKVIKLF